MSRVTQRVNVAFRRRRATSIEINRVCFVLGIMLLVLMVFMFPPAVTDLVAGHDDWQIFAGSAFVTGFLGLMLVMVTRGSWSEAVSLKEGFLLTVAAWVVIPLLAAIPFAFLERDLSLADAWFESVSGLTTTGATILTGLDRMSPGILLWRSITHWIGGVGIVLMALIMLPFLRVGGMQIFQAESSDRSDKFVPRAGEIMGLLVSTYVIMTLLCGIAYRWAGMSTFDALNHAMSTLSTGGFSTHDASLGYYEQPAIHWVAAAFMFAGSLPLLIFAKMMRTRSLDALRDEQVVGFLKLYASIVILLTALLVIKTSIEPFDALRLVAVNVISIMSTTGFALGDYTLWMPGVSGVFFLLMFLTGCTGSTAGGVKMFRIQIMLLIAGNYIRRLISPNRVVVAVYNGKQVTTEIATAVLAFLAATFVCLMLFTIALSLYDLDFVTALSSSATALTNVGPGLGPTVGPAGNFATLPEGAKALLAVAMLLGRLEYFTVLVVFSRSFWR
ncbi:MAG: TrkH family potassium uptake protein [Parvibaculaceae bacterium]